ncbi:MAG: hypothetical protein V7L25_23310 [Nostoc sp.]|uniref:hypothetical protein n=1 Tax=Nostoc sp. TaxID=1180 RepID=UPI002FF2FF9A
MPAAGVAIADLQGFIADSCDTCEARKAFSFKLVYQGYLYKEATDTKKTIELITEAKVYNGVEANFQSLIYIKK